MIKITYIEFSGVEHVVEASEGQSVMETAIKHAVPGIDADCGGACRCSTCHVYVEPEWLALLPEPSGDELSTLDLANNVESNSRLSCQLKVTPALNGFRVRMPESQQPD